MSQPFKLYRLQQIDSQLDRIRARLQEIETLLKADEALQEATQRAEASANRLQEARHDLRRAEENVRQQRLKIEQSEATLYSGKVHNPKELQDLQSEIASLKRFLGTLEDRQLEAMFSEEEAESEQQNLLSELEQEQARFSQQSQELEVEQERHMKDLYRFEEERTVTIPSIPAKDLSLYDQLRQKRGGIAVAKVTDRACSACGSTLSAALLHAARSPHQITRCDTCGRILYTG